MPEDLILSRVTLFCHRQLTNIDLSSKTRHVTQNTLRTTNRHELTRRYWRPDIQRYRITTKVCRKYWHHKNIRVVQLESTHGCKHPCLDSGATPIGSTERAPDKKGISISKKSRSSDSYECSTEDNFSPCPKLLRLVTRGLLMWALPFG
jgi:hypothetical protein